MDMVYVALILAFFVAGDGAVAICHRLMGKKEQS